MAKPATFSLSIIKSNFGHGARAVSHLLHVSTTWWQLPLASLVAVSCVAAVFWFRPIFSERTLVPNLEPFPDTFYYLIPAWQAAHGSGFVLSREGRSSLPLLVPPLYSLVLAPFMAFGQDVRWFYVANVVLIGSGVILLGTLRPFRTLPWWWQGVLAFIFVSQFHIRWLPLLAMAENLQLFLIVLTLWLVWTRPRWWSAAAIGVVGMAHYATKYAAAPLFLGSQVLALFQVFQFQTAAKTQIRKALLLYAVATGGAFLLFILWQKLYASQTVLDQAWGLVESFLPKPAPILTEYGDEAVPFFSLRHLAPHIRAYVAGMFGAPLQWLWDARPYWPFWWSIGSVLGWARAVRSPRHRRAAQWVTLGFFAQLLFLSCFYTVDGRYLLMWLPLGWFGGVLLVEWLEQLSARRYAPVQHVLSFTAAMFVLLLWSLPQLSLWRTQLAINFKYAESPWWYLAIRQHDVFFHSLSPTNRRPVFITASVPFHYDLFATQPVELLPLTYYQDFSQEAEKVWGVTREKSYLALYRRYLQAGRVVYASNWGLGNDPNRRNDWEALQQAFALEAVQEGCFGSCNLYRVRLKEEEK